MYWPKVPEGKERQVTKQKRVSGGTAMAAQWKGL